MDMCHFLAAVTLPAILLSRPRPYSLEHESAPATNGPGISLSGQYCIHAGTFGTRDAAPRFYVG